MRLNKWLAMQEQAESRRAADRLIEQARVKVNGQVATMGMQISETDQVSLDDQIITPVRDSYRTILYYKPRGVVSSHARQGEDQTLFDHLPHDFRRLKMIGRLDKMSEGLIILTNQGDKVQQLTHPSYEVPRTYIVRLNQSLAPSDRQQLVGQGVRLEDGLSRFDAVDEVDDKSYMVKLHQGRNHQIRRTFGSLGYDIFSLKRIGHGPYVLEDLKPGEWREV